MMLSVKFKKRAAVFYRGVKTRGAVFLFRKMLAASFLNGYKNIPQKACLLGVQTKVQTARGKQ